MRGQFGLSVQQQLMAGTAALVMMASASPAMAQMRTFDVPAQPASRSIPIFAKQAGVQMVASGNTMRSKRTNQVRGSYSVEEALRRLLEGTGLTATPAGSSGIITIQATAPGEAQAGSAAANDGSADIVVTGSHIANAKSVSPLTLVTKKEIEQSGYTTVGQVITSLPQSYTGGQNPGVASFTNSATNLNATNASTANLRGLGSDATLTLVNGHRLVSDGYFQSSDLSGIPLSAVSRIEVVADGASATYGSDAVAGVVNVILDRKYDGVETRAQVGGATQGGGLLQNYGILAGRSGEHSYAMVNLEYNDQNAIRASQRDFTSNAYPLTSLIQDQRRYSAFTSMGIDLSSSASVFFDGLYSYRSSGQDVSWFDTPQHTAVKTPAWNMTGGFNAKVFSDWKLTGLISYGGSRNETIVTYPDYPTDSSTQSFKNSLFSAEVSATGTLLRTSAGEVKVAVGAGYRQERFIDNYDGGYTGDRRNKYIFGELTTPLIAPSETRIGLNEFDISLASRAETYNDFGSTISPKFGFRYVPVSGFTFRGTWGRSFKAPRMYYAYQPTNVYLIRAANYGGSAGSQVLITSGGNDELKPERARSWTLGADFSAPQLSSLKITATYYSINFTDRVVTPLSTRSDLLSNPIFSPFIDFNPTSSSQQALINKSASFSNFSGGAYNPATVIAILNGVPANATSQKVDGIDLSYTQIFSASFGTIEPFASMSWLKIEQTTLPGLPTFSVSGRVDNPPTFKSRFGATFTHGGLSITSIVNHIDGMVDDSIIPSVHISSYTTADINLAFKVGESSKLFRDLKLSLSVSNLFDRDPPVVASFNRFYPGIMYDSSNHSAIGRFITFSISKAW